ncbi:MAG: UDP-2,3-diacylglucosamine hydrolase [Akkermansiaceae bacterium]
MKTGLVISDLHLFSERSRGDDLVQNLHPKLQKSQLLVLNGDTFDFRWSTLPDEPTTLQAATTWLTKLLSNHPHLEVHYVLGNHDCLTSFRAILEKFSTQNPHFHLHEFHCRLGTNLFLHGDCTNRGMTPEKLLRYRQSWSTDSPKGPLSKKLYRLVDASGLGLLFHKLYFKRDSTITRLQSHLTATSTIEGITTCHFGHTHLPFANHLKNGIAYHNTGSGIRGMGFLPQTFQASN